MRCSFVKLLTINLALLGRQPKLCENPFFSFIFFYIIYFLFKFFFFTLGFLLCLICCVLSVSGLLENPTEFKVNGIEFWEPKKYRQGGNPKLGCWDICTNLWGVRVYTIEYQRTVIWALLPLLVHHDEPSLRRDEPYLTIVPPYGFVMMNQP